MFREKFTTTLWRMSAACVVMACSLHAATNGGVVEGVVKSSAGQPVAGAFVKVKNAERRLTIMVVSQSQGRFAIDKLPDGDYAVQGVGNGFQSEWSAPFKVVATKPASVNLSLTVKQGPMLAPAWPGRTPEDDGATDLKLPEGKGKQLVSARCALCHTTARIVTTRRKRDDWKITVVKMREYMKAAKVKDLTAEEDETILDYISSNFGPRPPVDPNSRLPRTLLKGEATRYRVVEVDLPNPKAYAHEVAVDPYGMGWTHQLVGGKLGRFDPETLEYSEVIPPNPNYKLVHSQRNAALQISPQGVVWFPDGSTERRWLAYNIKAAKWSSYDFPEMMKAGPQVNNSMAIASDGSVWASESGSARRLDPVTKEWKSFVSPTWEKTTVHAGSYPGGYGITVAGDGKVWFAENQADLMARVDPVSGKVDEFKIPVQGKAYPRRMTTDANGDVWVGLWSAGRVLKIDYKSAEMTTYSPPSESSGPYSTSVDKRTNLVWVSLHRVDKLASFNPKTGEWVEFPLPQAESDVRRIELDPHHPNRIWFSGSGFFDEGVARIGYIELLDDGKAR